MKLENPLTLETPEGVSKVLIYELTSVSKFFGGFLFSKLIFEIDFAFESPSLD